MPFAIRDFVETGLADAALAELVTAATDEVVQRFGDDSEITLRMRGAGLPSLRLQRPALEIDSVTEQTVQGTVIGVLAVTDYALLNNGHTLVRLSGGVFSRQAWNDFVEIVYTPKPEASLRQQIIVNLVKLEVQYNGLASERIGDYNSSSQDYATEREKLLSVIHARRGFRFA